MNFLTTKNETLKSHDPQKYQFKKKIKDNNNSYFSDYKKAPNFFQA